MNDAVITLNGLEKRFPGMDKPAVAPLDCTIHAGYVTGLVGPDGAGKTTLMRMLAGLLKPDSGSATVIGFDPIKNDGALHAVLGYMPQKFGLYEDLTVMENLNLYADLRSVTGEARKQTFARLLEFTSLGPFTGRLAGKLSGGMKQKLGLACTLVGEPKVLLLDEPGVGVDPISRRELWQMVHELAGEGMLILWSTSYLDEAEQCRDVLLMNEGELLYQGGVEFYSNNAPKIRFVCLRRYSGEPMTTTTPQRIGGWLLGPLAWLLVALLSTTLALLLYTAALSSPQTFQTLGGQALTTQILWGVSFITAIAMWYYTLWLTIAFFKRRRCVPKHYIIWLLISVLLAVKAFAFSPVEDGIAVRQLLFTLLATALIVPYFKRSSRVKATFVNP